ncbi:carbohydrate-binding module family 1 protein [Xylogone sp. PMI_703]|nr:carbohydrate-binding module family 1 protein [Xylogone sp. PMI_703]
MRYSFTIAALAAIARTATSTILWDGRFNDLSSSTDLNNWSWSNEVGPYQYYIHGSEPVQDYVNLSPDYKNPADSGSKQGAKITLDSTAYWNGQNMRRTELIPQTTAPINQGKVYYHFSLMRSDTNAPSIYREHQMVFFESHFTEMKYGLISGEQATSDNQLRWDVNQVTYWNTTWDAGVWHNVAYGIDFSANTVEFYHSTGSNPLTLTHAAVSVSTSSNGADWHLGVLELQNAGHADTNEDYYFSGVYIESGPITTSVSGPGSSSPPPPPPPSSSSTTSGVHTSTTSVSTTLRTTTTTAAATTTTTAAGGTLPKWSQCAGQGWTGSGTCVAGTTCTYSNPWYSQCL